MIRSRYFLPGLALLLLGTLATGLYLYQNLPELLRQQTQRYLQQYGVDDIKFEGLQFTHADASVDTLVLRGAYENFTYQATLTSGELRYDWRALLSGKIDSLRLSSLDISIAQISSSQNRNAEVINLEQLLPAQLIAQLPLQSLEVTQFILDYHPLNGRSIIARGSLQIHQNIEAQITSTVAGREIMAVLRSESGNEAVNVDLALRDSQDDIATLSAQLARAATAGWLWQLQGQVQHTPMLSWLHALEAERKLQLGFPAASDLALQGESTFTASVQHHDALNFAAANDSDKAALRQLSGSFHVASTIHKLTVRDVVENLNTTWDVSGAVAKGQLDATIEPFSIVADLNTQLFSLPDKSRSWMHWGDTVAVDLATAEPLIITFANAGSWSLKTHNAALALGVKETRASLQNVNLDISALQKEQSQITTQFSASLSASLSTRLRKQALPQLEIALTQRGSVQHSELTLQVADTVQSMHAGIEGGINLATGSGRYQLNANIEDLPYLTKMVTPLLRHFKLLEETVDFRAGTIHLDTALASKTYDVADWEQQSQLSIEGVTGSINEYRFEGLALSAGWSGVTRWKTQQPLEVALAKLDLGVELKNIHLRASLPQSTPVSHPQVRLDVFSANLFGGQLSLPAAVVWDFAAPSNQITLQAHEWQLGEMVALQQNADIQAEGTLDGELPLTVTDSRIMIKDGYLRALPPGGSIRYRPNDESRALAESNAELSLALDLLSDFQYQTLSSEVQLDNAGNLLLGLSLAGSNPDQYDGQAINFNINVEQNIDPLLQSLRLSDNLVEQIERGLK